MTKWAVVENGIITEYYDTIPICWKNISNIDLLESQTDFMNSLGWYLVQDITQPLKPNQTYGEISWSFDEPNKVVIKNTSIVDNITTEEDPSIKFVIERESFMNALRQQRTRMISDCDWTQLKDIIDSKTPEWQKSWADYRQALRNLPEIYETNYPNEVDFQNIAWPNAPGV